MLEAEHDGSRAELRLGELNRPSKIIITQQLLVILARRNTTLDLRLLQPPDLHHFLGNCPGRSQKFVAPHSEHAYFGTSLRVFRDPESDSAAEIIQVSVTRANLPPLCLTLFQPAAP